LNHKELFIGKERKESRFVSTGIMDSLKISIPLPEEMRQQELKRLEKELLRTEQNLEKIDKQLSNKSFCERAPKELVDKQLELQERLKRECLEIKGKLNLLKD